MNKLQNSLKINAIFSSTSGLLLILFNQPISTIFGTTNNSVFWIVGSILIYFAFTIWYEIKKQRKLAVIWIITQDFTWVLGSIILLWLNPFDITKTGNSIIGVIALIVLFMGINQLIGLKNTKSKIE